MLTVDQAAAELGLSARRVRQLCESGQLRATKFGPRNWLILSAEIVFRPQRGRPKSTKAKKISEAETAKA